MKRKKWTCFILAAVVSLTLCIVSGLFLLTCMKPMDDLTYDLSLQWEGEAMPEDWVYDQKGWTVFTQDKDTVELLIPNGLGGFDGMKRPGETFYFSRLMSEKVDSPTLRLRTANRSITVFLDGAVIYTDCPELDNRIGYLELPTLEWDREEPVLVSLPANYTGKTLTIAQSTHPEGEKQQFQETVWPCAVTLYCGYAYESRLIAESFQTAIPVSLAFAVIVLLLALFTRQAFLGVTDPNTLCGGLLAFFWLIEQLAKTSLLIFTPPRTFDAAILARNLLLALLMVFLALRLTGPRRLFWFFAAAQIIIAATETILEITAQLTLQFAFSAPAIGLAGLLTALICGILEWKQNHFFRLFCPLTALGVILYMALGNWQFDGRSYGMLLWPLAGIMTIAALVTVLVEAIQAEITYHTELHLLAQQNKLAQSNYEAMRRQNEEVMILRHDMMKHFRLLRHMTAEEKTAQYLDELIGENEKIRPIVQSGNGILDTILNSKLSAAVDAGIQVEFTRMQAPDKLPLSDTELCSLIMNITDNALNAASEAKQQYIRLDMHIRNNFFVFICENGTKSGWNVNKNEPGHGFGLKIIRQIMERYGNLIKTEYGNDFYKVTVLLPLCQQPR